MPITPEILAIIGHYTLACRQLLNRLDQLSLATQDMEDKYLTYDGCLENFNLILGEFFKVCSGPLPEPPKEVLKRKLGDRAQDVRHLPRLAVIYEEIITAIESLTHHWSYRHDLDQWHEQGRILASRFFDEGHWAVIGKNPQDTCDWDVDYDCYGTAAPAAYLPKENKLIVRFHFDYDFAHYLTYPIFFLHEYTAHVYALDIGKNKMFNDGWMLYVACRFLASERQRAMAASGQFSLHEAQTWLRHQFIPHGMSKPFERRGYELAQSLHHLFHGSENCLRKISQELASFRPLPGEEEEWPTIFLKSLERELRDKRENPAALQALIDSLKTAANIRELKKSFLPFPWEKHF